MSENYHIKLEGDGIHAFECPISRDPASVTIRKGEIISIGCEQYGSYSSSRLLCKFSRKGHVGEVPNCLFDQKYVNKDE